ncbi:hypothetical protein [Lactococcus cremoris]|uniref:hypothetical protein n=1 Tax=Lactococcus lactis subsp. cremoris TaxID=1359 RepID=UPI002FC9950A
MNYFEKIDKDFDNTLNNLTKKFGTLRCIEEQDFDIESLKKYHMRLYVLRELIVVSNVQEDERISQPLNDATSDFIDFIWLLYTGRYKASIASLRNGLDIFARSMIRSLDSSLERDSFSNNVEKVLKNVRVKNEVHLTSNEAKKNHKTFINENFTENMKNLYKQLSDFIHGRMRQQIEVAHYLNNIIDFENNQSTDEYNRVINLGVQILETVYSMFLLVNYNKIDENENTYKLNLMIDQINGKFKIYKSQYLS